jgi:hypothetical protein
VLLRADVHLLFDKELMAIHPQTKILWVSDHLRDTDYVCLRGTNIQTTEGSRYLLDQYQRTIEKARVPAGPHPNSRRGRQGRADLASARRRSPTQSAPAGR